MSICKRYKMLKSIFKFTVGVLLVACALCYEIGWQRAKARVGSACLVAIEQAETRCLEQF